MKYNVNECISKLLYLSFPILLSKSLLPKYLYKSSLCLGSFAREAVQDFWEMLNWLFQEQGLMLKGIYTLFWYDLYLFSTSLFNLFVSKVELTILTCKVISDLHRCKMIFDFFVPSYEPLQNLLCSLRNIIIQLYFLGQFLSTITVKQEFLLWYLFIPNS